MNETRYRDASLPTEERVEDLLARMTLDEKLAQLGCVWSSAFIPEGRFDPDAALARIPNGIGQVTRIGSVTALRPRESAQLMNEIQRVVVERTRLGIPMFVHEEAVGGYCARDATVFPQGLGLAASWDPAMVESVATIIRRQMLAVGARLALSPVFDVARDPRWGRVEETYGEDPILCGAIGTAFVRGMQTNDLADGVAATGKHFLGYAMSEGGRNWNPVQMGPRELREVYAEPFAAAIRDANLACMMNSYASIDGLPCAANPAILTGLLRDELGFGGAVVADYDAVAHLYTYHYVAATKGEAAALALTAGLDAELPSWDYYDEPLRGEIEAGRVSLEVLDEAVRRVLRLKFQLGLFERPYVDAEAAPTAFGTDESRAVARQAAARATVLLTNDGVLPLRPDLKRLAVIGPGADDRRILQGDYHYPAHVEIIFMPKGQALEDAALDPEGASTHQPGRYYTPHVTPLEGLRSALPHAEIVYARGCEIDGDDTSGFDEAVRAAQGAEVAVLVLAGRSGLRRPATSGEFNDATNLDLTGPQLALLEAVAGTGTSLVIAVISGRVHTLARAAELASALLWTVPPGEQGGNGLADVLTGHAEAGRLPVSLPRSVGQIPNHVGQRSGGGRAMVFGDYIDSPTSPLFPLGHGLTYALTELSEFTVEGTDTTSEITASLEVRNLGDRPCEEVVQLYVRDEVASTARARQMLVGFARVSLDSAAAQRVTFRVHPSRLAFYNPQMRFVVEPGAFTFMAGRSAGEILAEATVSLTGPIADYLQREIIATAVDLSPTP